MRNEQKSVFINCGAGYRWENKVADTVPHVITQKPEYTESGILGILKLPNFGRLLLLPTSLSM